MTLSKLVGRWRPLVSCLRVVAGDVFERSQHALGAFIGLYTFFYNDGDARGTSWRSSLGTSWTISCSHAVP